MRDLGADLAAAWVRAALRLCGCSPNDTISKVPLPLRQTAKPVQIRVYAGDGIPAELIERQLEFRRARAADRRRNQRRSMDILSEALEDRGKWVRIAALALLQTFVRLRKAANSQRPASYLRADWRLPSSDEFEERSANLASRFASMDHDTIAAVLREHRGHAGYAAAALAQHPAAQSPYPINNAA